MQAKNRVLQWINAKIEVQHARNLLECLHSTSDWPNPSDTDIGQTALLPPPAFPYNSPTLLRKYSHRHSARSFRISSYNQAPQFLNTYPHALPPRSEGVGHGCARMNRVCAYLIIDRGPPSEPGSAFSTFTRGYVFPFGCSVEFPVWSKPGSGAH